MALFEKIADVEKHYNELTEMMAQEEVATNPTLLQKYAREQSELEPLVSTFRSYKTTIQSLEETQEMLNNGLDAEMRALAQEEIEHLCSQRDEMEHQINLLLLPRDTNDTRNVICEIRQGEGGDEAALFAADLYRMLYRYAENRGWQVEVINLAENGIGGYKEVTFEVRGEGVYSRLKYEGGVHRVQRVPETEARGRIHTSTATVAVLPETEPTDVELRDEDYRVDVFRAQGHGGQGVNTTDSAVRVVYKPGTDEEIVVTCQDSRSQLKNKAQALTVLRSRIYAREQARQQSEIGKSRLAQVGTGERAEKIRTYNFPQDRITDHRLGQNFSNLPAVLNGDLDRLIDALIVYDNTERMKEAGII
jgi:peptide chain release factor 1